MNDSPPVSEQTRKRILLGLTTRCQLLVESGRRGVERPLEPLQDPDTDPVYKVLSIWLVV